MDIDDLFQEVQEEISSTHEFLEMRASGKLTVMGVLWTVIAALIALGSLHELWLPWVKGDYARIGLLLAGILSLLLLCYWLRKPLFRLWKMLIKPMF
ncbi:MAG: hypothetical protein D3922_11015 [Candidatus Electrothrix sp. AR1]|nr:hypothetical protein [Candidatus Electrothrix sp. AR1]